MLMSVQFQDGSRFTPNGRTVGRGVALDAEFALLNQCKLAAVSINQAGVVHLFPPADGAMDRNRVDGRINELAA